MELRKNRRFLLFASIFLVVLVALGVVISVFFTSQKQPTNTAVIENLSSCSKNFNSKLVDLMNNSIYRYIKIANDYNAVESTETYTAVLREGTCREINETSGQSIRATEAIIDIEGAKQSWNIYYEWYGEDASEDTLQTDLSGVATLTCLPEDQLIYDAFNCEKAITNHTYGTDVVDPILPYVPYTSTSFNLSFTPNTRVVSVEIKLRGSQMNNEVLKANIRGQVEYWFTKRNLNTSEYILTYTYTNLDEGLDIQSS